MRGHLLLAMAILAAGAPARGGAAAGLASPAGGAVPLAPEERRWLSEHGAPIRVGVTPIPPQVLQRPDGTFEGLSIDYIRAIEHQLGLRVALVPYATWGAVVEAARARDIDVIFAAQRTPERDAYLLFTEPYIELPNLIIVRTDRQGGEHLRDMAGWSVAVSEGSAVHEHLRREYPALRLRPVPNERAGLVQVSLGEVDAMVVEVSRASYHIGQAGILNLRVAGDAGLLYQLRFAVRRDWPVLRAILDAGLASVPGEERQAISRRWIAVGGKPAGPSRLFLLSLAAGLGALGLAVLLVVLWNRSLRRLVQRRTEQLRRELAEHARAEGKLEEAQRLAKVGHWDGDLGSDRFTASAETRRILGLEPGERALTRAELHGRVHPEDRPAVDRAEAQALGDGTGGDVEYRVLLAGGEERVVHGHVEATRGDGRTGRIFGTVQDVTERRRAEQEIALLSFALNGVREAAFLIDERARFRFVNEEACRVLGYTRAELLARGVPDVDPDFPAGRWPDHWVELASRRSLLFEGRHRTRDGRVFPVEVSANFVEYGGQRYNLALVRDITERKQAEAEVRALTGELERRVAARTAQLEEANRELEAFAYSVSHDLRAPLRQISGFLELLQKRSPAALDEQGRHYLASIGEASARMATLIEDLLSFSRMGRVEMAREPVDLGELAAEVWRELEPERQGRSVRLALGRLPTVAGDRAMLRTVFANLLSNALKFTRPRAQAEIEIGCAAGGAGEAVVFVRDNGVGFDMRYVDKLFGVFQRLHLQGEFPGVGIGLANVRRVVARHGGRTWAEGEVGCGATFFLSLPAERSRPAAADRERPRPAS